MRKFTKKNSTNVDFSTLIRADTVLNESLIINDFKIISTKFGDMLIIDTDKGSVSSYSQVLIGQLTEEKENGFPIQVKIVKVKNYFTLAEV